MAKASLIFHTLTQFDHPVGHMQKLHISHEKKDLAWGNFPPYLRITNDIK
ncbi:MAG: hypothetical protein ACU0A2_13965 [Cognatishimia sp.]